MRAQQIQDMVRRQYADLGIEPPEVRVFWDGGAMGDWMMQYLGIPGPERMSTITLGHSERQVRARVSRLGVSY